MIVSSQNGKQALPKEFTSEIIVLSFLGEKEIKTISWYRNDTESCKNSLYYKLNAEC
jgi:hypothetical protein